MTAARLVTHQVLEDDEIRIFFVGGWRVAGGLAVKMFSFVVCARCVRTHALCLLPHCAYIDFHTKWKISRCLFVWWL